MAAHTAAARQRIHRALSDPSGKASADPLDQRVGNRFIWFPSLHRAMLRVVSAGCAFGRERLSALVRKTGSGRLWVCRLVDPRMVVTVHRLIRPATP